MLFSEKCADPDEKSNYACGNSSRPSLFAKVPLRVCFPKVVVNYVIYPTRTTVFQIFSNVFVSAVNT